MNREEYIKRIEELKGKKKLIDGLITKASADYIEDNKPCIKNSVVKIVLNSGRVVQGEALQFGILTDKNVYVTAYKCSKDNKTKYITVPHQKVAILSLPVEENLANEEGSN